MPSDMLANRGRRFVRDFLLRREAGALTGEYAEIPDVEGHFLVIRQPQLRVFLFADARA